VTLVKRLELAGYGDSEILIADGLDDACIGVAYRMDSGQHLAVYSMDKVVQCLTESGMEPDEAREYAEFNTFSAWVGERSPIWVDVLFTEVLVAARDADRADLEEVLELRLVERDLLIEERDSLVSEVERLRVDNSLVNVVLAHDCHVMRDALADIAGGGHVTPDRVVSIARAALGRVGGR